MEEDVYYWEVGHWELTQEFFSTFVFRYPAEADNRASGVCTNSRGYFSHVRCATSFLDEAVRDAYLAVHGRAGTPVNDGKHTLDGGRRHAALVDSDKLVPWKLGDKANIEGSEIWTLCTGTSTG